MADLGSRVIHSGAVLTGAFVWFHDLTVLNKEPRLTKAILQGYLAQQKTLPPQGPPSGPRHSPNVGA